MCAGGDDLPNACLISTGYGQRGGSSVPSSGTSILPGPGMQDTGQPSSGATMTETGSFSDVAHLHLPWHRGKVPHAPQLAELTPERADLKSMPDGMMVFSMPVIVELASESPLTGLGAKSGSLNIVSVVQQTPQVI